MLLWHYGFKEYDYYTVLFGVSRGIGALGQMSAAAEVLARGGWKKRPASKLVFASHFLVAFRTDSG